MIYCCFSWTKINYTFLSCTSIVTHCSTSSSNVPPPFYAWTYIIASNSDQIQIKSECWSWIWRHPQQTNSIKNTDTQHSRFRKTLIHDVVAATNKIPWWTGQSADPDKCLTLSCLSVFKSVFPNVCLVPFSGDTVEWRWRWGKEFPQGDNKV